MDEKNCNQAPNANGDEQRKPPKKRTPKKPVITKRTLSAIYMGVAVCMVAMLTVSLISTNNSVNQGIEDLNDLSFSIPDVSISVPDTDLPSKPDTNKPAGTDTSGVDDEVIVPTPQDPPTETVQTYVRPVSGEVLKGYYSDALVFSETMQDYRTHNGVDIAAEIGTDVLAYTDGTVSKIEHHPFMGTSVEISHNAGVTSVYRNLSKSLPNGIKVGTELKAGDVIGTVGNTAILEIADKPHLHFEIWMEGTCINAQQEIAELN